MLDCRWVVCGSLANCFWVAFGKIRFGLLLSCSFRVGGFEIVFGLLSDHFGELLACFFEAIQSAFGRPETTWGCFGLFLGCYSALLGCYFALLGK